LLQDRRPHDKRFARFFRHGRRRIELPVEFDDRNGVLANGSFLAGGDCRLKLLAQARLLSKDARMQSQKYDNENGDVDGMFHNVLSRYLAV
jgi:hypothetical protein